MSKQIKVGDKVTFNTDNLQQFIEETSTGSREVRKYQELVIAGINEIGTVKEIGLIMANVAFEDGWDMPMPTKHLIVLPKF